MKQTLLFFPILLATTFFSYAQQRTIARGAIPGELYMTTEWYGLDTGWGYDTLRYALLHIAEHSKKAEIVYSCNYLDRDKMQPEVVLTDATEGVVYIHDRILRNGSIDDRLWISFDYGKNWELRDEPVYQSVYVAANVEGFIYRSGGWGYGGGAYKSTDYGETFIETDYGPGGTEPGLQNGEAFSVWGIIPPYTNQGSLKYTCDFGRNYIEIQIDSLYVSYQIGGFSPDIFRGGKEGEVTSHSIVDINKCRFSGHALSQCVYRSKIYGI